MTLTLTISYLGFEDFNMTWSMKNIYKKKTIQIKEFPENVFEINFTSDSDYLNFIFYCLRIEINVRTYMDSFSK